MRRTRSGCCARTANGQAAAAPPISVMNSRRLIDAPEAQDQPSYRLKPAYWKGANVRFGSKADMCGAQADVRFVPIADMCGALAHVCFVPKGDRHLLAQALHACSNRMRLCGVGGNGFAITLENPAARPMSSNSRAVYASPCGVEPSI